MSSQHVRLNCKESDLPAHLRDLWWSGRVGKDGGRHYTASQAAILLRGVAEAGKQDDLANLSEAELLRRLAVVMARIQSIIVAGKKSFGVRALCAEAAVRARLAVSMMRRNVDWGATKTFAIGDVSDDELSSIIGELVGLVAALARRTGHAAKPDAGADESADTDFDDEFGTL